MHSYFWSSWLFDYFGLFEPWPEDSGEPTMPGIDAGCHLLVPENCLRYQLCMSDCMFELCPQYSSGLRACYFHALQAS